MALNREWPGDSAPGRYTVPHWSGRYVDDSVRRSARREPHLSHSSWLDQNV